MEEICNHDRQSKKSSEVIDKHGKIMHKIHSKFSLMIKATGSRLSHINLNQYIVQIMRDLNKHKKLHGFEKKDLCILIIVVLLDSLGMPGILSELTAELIEESIEHIYHLKIHKYKRVSKFRFWR